jgi:hypothetical protein
VAEPALADDVPVDTPPSTIHALGGLAVNGHLHFRNPDGLPRRR